MTQNQGRVAAVVVTYNRLDKLKVTVDRLLESPAEHLSHLIVVDNASTDGTADWLSGLADPRVEILTLPENLGGAGGFEAGMRHATETYDPEWIVVMDDDARPEPGTLTRFHARDRTGYDAWAAAVWYPAETYPEGRFCEMNRPWVNPFWHGDSFWKTMLRGRDGFHIDPAHYRAEEPLPIDGGSFVGFFFSRRAVQLAGYPDARLFIYGDDVLYTLGLSAAGGTTAFDPELRWEHDCGTYADDKARVFSPAWKIYYAHRNSLMFYRAASGRAFPLVLPVILAKWALSTRRYRGQRMRFLRLMTRGVSHGLRGRLDATHRQVMDWAR
ncbi:glycosyltransferase [Histidinibacterium aquaticum]|uniref:Glycosyltransferase n=1 Tax=Histidinibacterium aquaticum TaxID=2613962 RepID=A0A5J5GGB3_9RHOB|nr:glycosyltransferase [Histidinibacterium aquaticum]KAA9006792.1 glycosyltransferase [Histidinibacterium aquaticum]